MAIKPKGGRGKKAPYETIQMRVPVPIKDEVNKLIDAYRLASLGEQPASKDHELEKLYSGLEELITKWESKRSNQSAKNERWKWATEILKDLKAFIDSRQTSLY